MDDLHKLALCVFGVVLGASSFAAAQSRNDVLPREYRAQRYVYDGWRERGLPKPAAGQEWIHVCDSYILASMRTGRVDQVHVEGRSRVDQNPDWRLANSFDCMRGRGSGRDHTSWAMGQSLPRAYMQPRYVYHDWRDSGLRPPPRGYQWMKINNQFVLAGARTGVIADVMDIRGRGRD